MHFRRQSARSIEATTNTFEILKKDGSAHPQLKCSLVQMKW